MSEELKDILSNSNKDIDNQALLNYLGNKLSGKGSHDIEKNMVDDPFMNDAVEGLQEMDSKKDLQVYIDQLNYGLQKQLAKKKNRRNKRRWRDQPYVYVAIIIILLLLALCYAVFNRM